MNMFSATTSKLARLILQPFQLCERSRCIQAKRKIRDGANACVKQHPEYLSSFSGLKFGTISLTF